MDKKLQERLEKLCIPEPNTGCWFWLGAVGSGKYGHITYNKRNIMAHRFAYIAYKGEIPKGLEIDHLCYQRLCVNPDHLEAVTPQENIRRQRRVKSPFCKNGHLFDAVRATGGRRCHECDRQRQRKQRQLAKRCAEYFG